jgi:hypothetical protein
MLHTEERFGVGLARDNYHHGIGFDEFTELRCYPLGPPARSYCFGMRGRINERRLGFLPLPPA